MHIIESAPVLETLNPEKSSGCLNLMAMAALFNTNNYCVKIS